VLGEKQTCGGLLLSLLSACGKTAGSVLITADRGSMSL